MRLFVAIEIDEAIRAALAKLIEDLRRAGESVKWVEAKNIHLTLKFLGEVPDTRALDAAQIVRECAAGTAPFRLTLRGAGAFPDLRRPRVLFVDALDERHAAHQMAERLNERMTALNVEPEDRPFQNHITLGRLRMPKPVPGIAERLEALSQTEFGSMSVGHVTLMRSQLTPQGPIYTPVEKVELTGS